MNACCTGFLEQVWHMSTKWKDRGKLCLLYHCLFICLRVVVSYRFLLYIFLFLVSFRFLVLCPRERWLEQCKVLFQLVSAGYGPLGLFKLCITRRQYCPVNLLYGSQLCPLVWGSIAEIAPKLHIPKFPDVFARTAGELVACDSCFAIAGTKWIKTVSASVFFTRTNCMPEF